MLRSGERAAYRRFTPLAAGSVFVLALVCRLAQLVHGGALIGLSAYDQSVYYAAADAVLHGRAPYTGDFVFLHPPVIVLVGLPFALLGWVTTAPIGFTTEGIAFEAMAAIAAALIVVVARRAGAPRWAAVAGGVFYATWSVAVAASSSVRLEPLGDLLLMIALYLLGPGHDVTRRQRILAGVALALLLNVKLWWVVPVAVVLLATLPIRRGLREVALVPVVAVVTAAVVDLPFLLASRGHMLAMVVTSQLGRAASQATPSGAFGRLSTMVRLERLTGVESLMGELFGIKPEDLDSRVPLVTAVVCVLVVLTAALALRTPLGRVAVPLFAAQVLVLLAAPIYFPYYGDFVGVAFGLMVAAAAVPAGRRLRALPWLAAWPAAAVLTLALMLTAARSPIVAQPPDSAALTRATRDIPCLVADSPRLLIMLDALDRSFENGCRNWVDFQGVERGDGHDPKAYVVGSTSTRAWKRVVARYFRSGDAFAMTAPNVRTFLGPARLRHLTRGQLIARSETVVIYRSPRHRR